MTRTITRGVTTIPLDTDTPGSLAYRIRSIFGNHTITVGARLPEPELEAVTAYLLMYTPDHTSFTITPAHEHHYQVTITYLDKRALMD